MSRLWGIGAIQMAPVPYDVQATLERLEGVVAQTSATLSWVQMLCFPELILDALVQFEPRGNRPRLEPETIPGPITDRLCVLAARHKKWLIPGSMSERVGDTVYNTSIVISPEGELVARYRKMFPWRPLELCSPGDSFCVFQVPGVGTFGLCVCYDMWFPEVARTLAWMGAEVILHPSLTATSDRAQEIVLCQANAIFNQCYFVDINATGPFGGGRSSIVDPDGRMLQLADQHECVLTELLDLDRVTHVREYGTVGLTQTWKALRDMPVHFPPYERGIGSSPMVQALGSMQYQSNLTAVHHNGSASIYGSEILPDIGSSNGKSGEAP